MATAQGTGLDGGWASDHWEASRLGAPARRGRGAARFDTITQGWLREPAKRWSRFRLATGCAFSTITAGALAISRAPRFLSDRCPSVGDATGITRPVLEDYMAWLLGRATRRHPGARPVDAAGVLRRLPPPRLAPWPGPNATIYVEELPFHHDEIARFIPEFVMAQLESEAALAKIPNPSTRNLVVLIMETGLRGGDACNLAFSLCSKTVLAGPACASRRPKPAVKDWCRCRPKQRP